MAAEDTVKSRTVAGAVTPDAVPASVDDAGDNDDGDDDESVECRTQPPSAAIAAITPKARLGHPRAAPQPSRSSGFAGTTSNVDLLPRTNVAVKCSEAREVVSPIVRATAAFSGFS